jgi:hypothetical protein
VKGSIARLSSLDTATRQRMYALFSTQFDGVSIEAFLKDLEEKNWVLLIHDDAGNLICFSSMLVFETRVTGRDYFFLYSGDTVVDKSTWSNSALSYYWMGAADWLRRLYKKDRIYWFLMVSGYRTYRFLPVYSELFFPRYDMPTPDDIQTVMHTIANQRFGSQYDPATGIVRLKVPAILKNGYSGIPDNRMRDPHIAFFAQRNPGHLQGDELVCFSALSEDTMTRLGKRMWRKGQKLFPDQQ